MKPAEFDQLLALVMENEASAEQVDIFHEAIKANSTLLQETKRQFTLHGQLGIALESELAAEKFISNTNTALTKQEGDEFSDGVTKKIKSQLWIKRAVGIVALLLVGFFLTQTFTSKSGSQKEMIIATITRVDGLQWKENTLNEGDSITMGQSIHIDSGLIEVDLGGRGSLVIEGPAHLDFTSDMESVLHRGSLVMRATQKGHGYTVKTSQGCVIDIGTEFAVTVGEDNVAETHVIEGSVEAITNDGKSVTLKINDALRFDKEGGESITSDVGRFYTAMPPIHGQTRFIHWNFNENEGLIARATGELEGGSAKSKDLILHAIDEGASPRWVNGKNKTGLDFDGKGGYAESAYKGIQGGNARTVCCWVKVPSDFSTKQGFGIISWGNHTKHGETWQISVNPLRKDGKVGRLRLGLQGGQIIGSTDLRDGSWHNIAVVLYGGSTPNVGTHALLYIDGKKESVSRASLQEVKTTTNNDDHGVWIGRNVTYDENKKSHPQGRFFRGGIDELYIFDTALSQTEVQEIMEKK